MTSRNQLTSLVAVEGAFPLTLDVLADGEAQELLTRRLGPERVAADPGAADELIRLCARLPLALSIAAARTASQPGLSLAGLAAELRDAPGGWTPSTPGRRPRASGPSCPGPTSSSIRPPRGCSGCSGCTPARTSARPPRPAWPGWPYPKPAVGWAS